MLPGGEVVIPAAFIDEYPCETCEHVKVVYDIPPYTRCRLSNTCDYDCELMQSIARIADRAEQVAALLTRESDHRIRVVEAAQVADAYANTLYELGAGFDDTAFYRACHVLPACRTCEERTPADGYTRLCADCAVVKVAV